MFKPRFFVLSSMILAAVLARLLPHPWNVTPVAAMALFAGARFDNRAHAFLIPLAALFLSDLFLGFHLTMPFVYAGFALMVCIGFWLRGKDGIVPIGGAVLGGSMVFFLVTNFGSWIYDPIYPKTAAGLMTSYAAAIPFFRMSLLGNIFYAAVLFGGFSLAEKRFPVLRGPAFSHS